MADYSNLNLIIPMAGYGERFKKAGYDVHKPFIEINGKSMVDHVLDAFPKDIKKWLIVNPDLITGEQRKYLLSKPNVRILDTAPHKEGPSRSIMNIAHALPLHESFFISYVDHLWTWDFSEVERFLEYDGIVFTRRNFHPHMIRDNFSAFCKPDGRNPRLLARIKEKGSFTDDWMHEPHSIGVYYFKSGNVMVDSLRAEVEDNIRAAGEFYPSQAMNRLVDAGMKVYIFDVDFYIHWGVPEQLHDFERWAKVIKHSENKVLHVGQKMPGKFILASNENYALADSIRFREFVEENHPDAVVFTYSPTLTQRKLSRNSIKVTSIGSQIVSLHERTDVAPDGLPIAGFIWVAQPEKVALLHKDMPSQEQVGRIVADMIIKGMNVMSFHIDHYMNTESENEKKELQYWKSHSSIFKI